MKEYIYGKNTVREALNVNNRIIKLNVSKNNTELIDIAKKKGIKLNIVDNNYLNKLVEGNHQGAVLEIEGYSYVDVDEIISNPKGKLIKGILSCTSQP